MDDKLSGLQNNNMFEVKDKIDGGKTCKGRLAVKGIQQNGEDDSPVAKITIITSMLNAVTSENLRLDYLDVNTIDILYDNLEGEILKVQPESALTAGKKKLVFKKKENMYGMKQTSKQW